jgi:hypothetical protein
MSRRVMGGRLTRSGNATPHGRARLLEGGAWTGDTASKLIERTPV